MPHEMSVLDPQWIAKAHLVFDYFSCSSVLEVYQRELVDVVGFPFNYKYENLDVFYDQRDVERHAELLVHDGERVEREVRFMKAQIEALLEASKRYGARQDREAFEAWFAVYGSFLPTLGLVFGLECALERWLREFLSESDLHKMAFAKDMPTIHEQRSLLRLAQLPSESAMFDEALSEHLRRFSWLGNKMMRETPFTEEHILERVEAARATAVQRSAGLEQQRRTLEADARSVLQRVSMDQARLIHLYREILALRTQRADAVCLAAQDTHPLFVWMADHLRMTREELLRFSKREISEMMETGERKDPTPREKYSLSLMNGKTSVLWGSWGGEKTMMTDVREIRGVIACKGIARGVVKIVNEVADMRGFQKGNILVASYTNPNLLPAIELSSAIVTNIGGMTSHAAIVSRELNKPCIIGTKMATSALKDGDEVEVDAENGVVKLLKRSS